jgi:hypothetical protein
MVELCYALEADRGSLPLFKTQVFRALDRAQKSLEHHRPEAASGADGVAN